jgi:hypothetical protein
VLPAALKMLILPLALKCTIARLACTPRALRLMFEATGTDAPAGNAVTYVMPLLLLIAVRLTATAEALDGTVCPSVFCSPVTWSVSVAPAPSVSPVHWLAGPTSCVSQIRNGVTAVYAPGAIYMNWSAGLVALIPPGVTAVMSTVPA